MNRFILFTSASALLTSCGGGGGGGSSINMSVANALVQVASAPNGWTTACSNGEIYIVSASGDQLTIESQLQDNGASCSGVETTPRQRAVYTAASASASGAAVTLTSPSHIKISYAPFNTTVLTTMNTATSGGATGMCEKTSWVLNTYADITSTSCFNFTSAPSVGPGTNGPTHPFTYSHAVPTLTFTVNGNTMTDSLGHSFTKL